MAKDWKNSRMEGEIKVHEKEMMEKARLKKVESKVNTAHAEINELLEGKLPNNDNRELVKTLLLEKLDFECKVKCDQENNPPNIVDQECIIARIMYDFTSGGEFKYINVVFGNSLKASRILISLQ